MVGLQALDDGFSLIILAPRELGSAALVAYAGNLSWFKMIMIARTAFCAGKTPRNTLDEFLVIDLQLNDIIEFFLLRRKHGVKRFRLREREHARSLPAAPEAP